MTRCNIGHLNIISDDKKTVEKIDQEIEKFVDNLNEKYKYNSKLGMSCRVHWNLE